MNVILFGIAREIVGESKVLIPTGEGVSTVQELKGWMKSKYPRLSELKSFAVAVDSEYAEDTQAINSNQEVAIIPPVSGG